jgi:hypothetical protein
MTGDVLFVGSLPFVNTEEAFRQCARMGSDVTCLPDGETGERKMWINYLPEQILSSHPDLEETHRPDPEFFNHPDSDDDPESPPGMTTDEAWLFRIKPGVEDLRFDLGYQRFALDSYGVFRRLREEGTIPFGVAFQVSLPATMSAIDCWFEDPSQWERAHDAYRSAIHRHISEIREAVPAEDLVIQFDVCEEVVDLALGDRRYHEHNPDRTFDEKFKAHTKLLIELIDGVPDEIPVGTHWCYGTWGGWPMVAMRDLGLCVALSNAAVGGTARRLDYVHMPAARTDDESFYAPLEELDIGDTRVYLGLVHHEDGVDGFSKRLRAARECLDGFGIGAVCGYGRSEPAEVGDVVGLHQECLRLLRSP